MTSLPPRDLSRASRERPPWWRIGRGAGAILAAGLLAAAAPAAGQEPGPSEAPVKHPPLFPVALDTEFPDAAQTFASTLDLIRDHYYFGGVTDEALYHAAIEGMLRHVSPPDDPERAKIWSPQEYERIANALKGVRTTLGIKSSFNPGDGALTVTEVLPGSAADGWLQPFDRIVRIGDERLLGQPVARIDALLNGEPGTTVRLTVVRDVQVLNLELTLTVFRSEDVVESTLPGDVAYLAIRRVSTNVSGTVARRLRALADAGVDRLVVDLRGNAGGIFAEGLRLAELFLEKGRPILYTLQRGDQVKSYVSGNTEPARLDTILLVDGKTASASEIFAAALQRNGAARLVGTHTFGKATMEQTFTLENDFRVKFIVGALYGPGGKSWYATGLQPDVPVDAGPEALAELEKLPPEQRVARDRQLHAAWLLLR